MTDTPTEARVNELLADVYTEVGCHIWWSSPNLNTGGRVPAWLWLFGTNDDRDRVFVEAERVAGGAW